MTQSQVLIEVLGRTRTVSGRGSELQGVEDGASSTMPPNDTPAEGEFRPHRAA